LRLGASFVSDTLAPFARLTDMFKSSCCSLLGSIWLLAELRR
jgi:hypothetical protein